MSAPQPRIGGWCATFSGRQFWPLSVRPDDLSLVDIAHALSLQCRFNGHVREFYSVAEHSVRVSWACPAPAVLWGLLHDAPEAYIGDMVRPLKNGPGMERYREIDDEMLRVVAERFGLSWPVPEAVWAADNRLLHAEARDLLRPCPDQWWNPIQAHPDRIQPWSPAEAKARFLERYAELVL